MGKGKKDGVDEVAEQVAANAESIDAQRQAEKEFNEDDKKALEAVFGASSAAPEPTPIEPPAQTIAEIDAERRDSEAAHIWFHAVAAVTGDTELGQDAEQAECMAAYFRKHPDAPENSAEIQVRMVLKTQLLPGVLEGVQWLCVSLFKQALLGRDGFQRVEDVWRETQLERANAQPPRPLDEDERSFHMESGLRDEPSDLAKALAARPATQ